MSKLLEVKNLSVRLNGNSIFEAVNFDVEKGETVAIIGPNGAGKTMLFRALLGLVPYSGEIRFGEKPRFGYVPQRFEFDRSFPLSVEEYFLSKSSQDFWLKKQSAKAKIASLLEETGLKAIGKKRLGDLSAGELQRVLIAYALWGDPNILLFDEPTANVDVGVEEKIYELIHRIGRERNLTVLMISHDLSITFHYATRVVCLNRELICYGVPKKVLTPDTLAQLYQRDVHFFEHTHHH